MMKLSFAIGFLSLAFFLPWVGFAAPRSPGLLIPLISVFAIGACLWQFRSIAPFQSRVWIFLGVTLALTALSCLWALDWEIAVGRLSKLVLFLPLGVALLLLGGRLSTEKGSVLQNFLILGGGLGIAALGLHISTGAGLYGLLKPGASAIDLLHAVNRPSVVLLLCFSSIFLALQKSQWRWAAWPTAFLLLVLFASSSSQSALFGMLVWSVSFGAMVFIPSIARPLLVWGGALFILLHPGLILLVEYFDADRTLDFAAGSVGARLDLWYAVSHKILESPIYGHGLEAARTITDWSVEFVYYRGSSMLHPHNGILQVWLELGLIGALLAAYGWVWISKQVTNFSDEDRPAVTAVLAAFLFVVSVSHGLWQSWWINSLFGISALTIIAAGVQSPGDRKLLRD
ncbi:MAG: O-antigen ligase family protein [Gammaproteobacteria bacterium]|nr:O-antigen ligase family protein [Gammaproteobacteria bacterium]